MTDGGIPSAAQLRRTIQGPFHQPEKEDGSHLT